MLTGISRMENEPGQKDNHRPDMSSQETSQLRKIGLFAIIVSDLIGYTVVGVGLGYLAWVKWSAPWWVPLVTSLAGLSLAFYKVYRISQKEW